MKLYSIHDSKAEAYLPPLTMNSKGEAIRAFDQSCQDKESNFYKYPHDFTLVELGEWDQLTAKFTLHPAPVIVNNASEFVNKIN